MRTIARSWALILATVLVAVAALPVSAQTPDPLASATLTATTVLDGDYIETPGAPADGVTPVRADFRIRWTATDPRASGLATYGVDRQDHDGATVHSGTFRLENEAGTWVGTFIGWWDAAGRHYVITAAGEGTYAGLTLHGDDVCACDTPTSAFSGVIVPGGLSGLE